MPIYTYKCPSCELTKDFLLKSDDHAPLCPICCWNPDRDGGEEIMVRQLSKTSNPKFNGSGFYETDYKDKQ